MLLALSKQILKSSRNVALLQETSFKCLTVSSAYNSTNETSKSEHNQNLEPDALYKKLILELRSHDPAVLKSYDQFVTLASKELNIPHVKTYAPGPGIYTKERRELLKSVFVHKKHYVHYEMRTYHKIMEFKNITGSTADTFLEYIQRNLPEGTSMKVIKHELKTLPEHITQTPAQKTKAEKESPVESPKHTDTIAKEENIKNQ